MAGSQEKKNPWNMLSFWIQKMHCSSFRNKHLTQRSFITDGDQTRGRNVFPLSYVTKPLREMAIKRLVISVGQSRTSTWWLKQIVDKRSDIIDVKDHSELLGSLYTVSKTICKMAGKKDMRMGKANLYYTLHLNISKISFQIMLSCNSILAIVAKSLKSCIFSMQVIVLVTIITNARNVFNHALRNGVQKHVSTGTRGVGA